MIWLTTHDLKIKLVTRKLKTEPTMKCWKNADNTQPGLRSMESLLLCIAYLALQPSKFQGQSLSFPKHRK